MHLIPDAEKALYSKTSITHTIVIFIFLQIINVSNYFTLERTETYKWVLVMFGKVVVADINNKRDLYYVEMFQIGKETFGLGKVNTLLFNISI